jgi:hypothetical protein
MLENKDLYVSDEQLFYFCFPNTIQCVDSRGKVVATCTQEAPITLSVAGKYENNLDRFVIVCFLNSWHAWVLGSW